MDRLIDILIADNGRQTVTFQIRDWSAFYILETDKRLEDQLQQDFL
jgi:hypothetical protein